MKRLSQNRPTIRLAVAALLVAAGAARAQCNPTFNIPPGITYPEGINGDVLCSVLWDPDGTGPKSQCLVVGGAFNTINASGYNNIAMFDGSGWRPLHIGVNGAVRALTVDTSNNSLIAGGDFSSAGLVTASKLARYSSNTGLWSAIGTGITSGGSVNALCYDTLRNVLYIGGGFSHAGGVATGALARHNGSTYSAVGAFFTGTVNALFHYQSEDSVYVGGTFVDPTLGNAANILKYAIGPNSWSGLQGGLPGGGVNAIAIYSPDGLNQRIVAAGTFGVVNGRVLNSIATYEGSSGWWPLATGISGIVRGLTTRNFGKDLYAVGGFTLTGAAQTVNHVSMYNGIGWLPVGTGLNSPAYVAATYKDAIYVGGSFTQAGNADGNTTVNRIALHDGARWSPLRAAPSGPVRCMLSLGSSMLIGGNFDMHVGNNVFARNLATFNGSQFGAMVGVQGFNGTNGPINAIIQKSNGITIPQTIVAGKFTTAGAVNASNIASYEFAGEFSQVGNGVNGEVFALSNFGSTGGPFASIGTVATGNFTATGATPVGYIVRWGPGAVSNNLGTGLNAPGRCLLNYQGKLLVGGNFSTAGGVLTGHLAQWDGTTWSTFNGTIVNDNVYAMTIFEGKLVIAGDFTLINGNPIRKVAMYDGNQWIDMSAGIDTSVGSVAALAVHKGELYAGGAFATVNGQPRAIARWNGFSWTDIGTPENPTGVGVLASFGDSLMVGGDFLRAGNAYAPYLSQYKCACYVNCDNSTGSPVLTANDFTCFLTNFAVGTSYANCDGSTGSPTLTANDFTCFLTKYAAGCN